MGWGRRQRLHFLQQDEQLRQLLLWRALVWHGDGGGQVLDEGGAVEGDGEAGGAVGWDGEADGAVEVEG